MVAKTNGRQSHAKQVKRRSPEKGRQTTSATAEPSSKVTPVAKDAGLPPPASEHQIQAALCEFLSHMAGHHVLYFSVPNAAPRSYRAASWLKKEGMTAGAPDLVICCRGATLFLELKTLDGKHSPDQKEMEAAARRAGILYRCCFGVDNALDVVKIWLAEKLNTGDHNAQATAEPVDGSEGQPASGYRSPSRSVIRNSRRRSRDYT